MIFYAKICVLFLYIFSYIYFLYILIEEDMICRKRTKKKNMVKRKRRGNLFSYRFAHLLLPLKNVWNWMVARELNVTVEDDAIAKNGCNMNGILTWNGSIHIEMEINKHNKNSNLNSSWWQTLKTFFLLFFASNDTRKYKILQAELVEILKS